MDEIRVGILPRDFWEPNWSKIAEMLERAIIYTDDYTVDDVLFGLQDKEYEIWGVVQGMDIKLVLVVELLFFPKRWVLNIMIAAGMLEPCWIGKIQPKVEAFAKDNNCSAVRLGGRKGWKRLLHPFGYEQRYIQLEKQLGD